ncbi:MAG: SRPBCC domain-containing protein [Methanomassiliicoccales archaeon]|nr:SRPBCC domain-containing protein [Methanomassiliicoccales archaeon]
MKEIKGTVMINEPAAKVWTTITDFASYPEWNPFITLMKGELKEGNVFDVTVSLPDRQDTKFQSKLVKVEPHKEMLFHGKIKGVLMTDDHSFLIEPLEENECVFSQNIVFRGLLSYLTRGIICDSEKGLQRMNEETKKRCEKK